SFPVDAVPNAAELVVNGALIPDNYIFLLIVSIVSTVIVVFTSIVYRTIKGKNYPVIPERDITFTERWVSGSSQKNLLTKLGGASNCLSVTLSGSALVVRPMFPFNLMFLPEIYDLEHVIARKRYKENRTEYCQRLKVCS